MWLLLNQKPLAYRKYITTPPPMTSHGISGWCSWENARPIYTCIYKILILEEKVGFWFHSESLLLNPPRSIIPLSSKQKLKHFHGTTKQNKHIISVEEHDSKHKIWIHLYRFALWWLVMFQQYSPKWWFWWWFTMVQSVKHHQQKHKSKEFRVIWGNAKLRTKSPARCAEEFVQALEGTDY